MLTCLRGAASNQRYLMAAAAFIAASHQERHEGQERPKIWRHTVKEIKFRGKCGSAGTPCVDHGNDRRVVSPTK